MPTSNDFHTDNQRELQAKPVNAKLAGAKMYVIVDIPDAKGKPPFAALKRLDKTQEALSQKDQGRAEALGGSTDKAAYIDLLLSCNS